MFLRKSRVNRDPLAVTMSGVRLGERALQIGAGAPDLVALIAAKPGLSGTAAIVVSDERDAARLRDVIAGAGTLADVHVSPLGALPFPDSAFDVVVVHDASRTLGAVDAAARSDWLRECRRALRLGGRIVAIEAGSPVGLRALLGGGRHRDRAADAGGATAAALRTAGFTAVRLLADREGSRFIEGLKTE